MQVSSRKINANLEKQIEKMLYGILADIKSPETIAEVINDLLTETERVALVKRLGIAVYLDKGRSYEDIKNNLKVSSATIATVAENLGGVGMVEAIRRVKAEEWATEWTEKLGKKFGFLVK